MTKEQIYEFIRNNPVCALSTADENIPHVRFMMIYRADKDGIIFTTGEDKDLHRQLERNPLVEMSFYNAEEGIQIRVSGSVDELEDIELKKQVVEDFPFLKEWVDKKGYDVIVAYILSRGKATVWTIETNFAEKEFIDL